MGEIIDNISVEVKLFRKQVIIEYHSDWDIKKEFIEFKYYPTFKLKLYETI